MKLQKQIVNLSLAVTAAISGTTAFATAEQFIELCSVSSLPEPTKSTFDTLQKYAFGFGRAKSCTELTAALKKKKILDLPGQTFFYYSVRDLTPISFLDWVEVLNIPDQEVDSRNPLTRLKLTSLDITGVKTSADAVAEITSIKNLGITFDPAFAHPALLIPLTNLESLVAQFASGGFDLNQLPTSISKLNISGFGLKSLRGIERLQYPEAIQISNVKLANLDGLNRVNNHRVDIKIENSEIKSFKAISALQGLEKLSILSTNLESLDFLSPLTALKALDLEGNKILDVTPLAKLNNLEELNLAKTESGERPLSKA